MDAAQQAVLFSPETSGGILAVLPASRVAGYLAAVPEAIVIGRVAGAVTGGHLSVLATRSHPMPDCCAHTPAVCLKI